MKSAYALLVFIMLFSGKVVLAASEKAATPGPGPEILTPPAPAAPRINGPGVYGVRPHSPFLYRIPCTGLRPITFAASGLPSGLKLDATTGIITGEIDSPGTHVVTLHARNTKGQSQKEFHIVVGNQLALTPPMGWNSWYIHYNRVNDKVMRQAADQMIATGMADYGYQYVNIDDCWMVKPGSTDPELGGPARDAEGRLIPNRRFPDMSAMTAYIHAKGLKAGTYISPGPLTCAGYEGSYGHEALDARTFAQWGFDFLKYDWCSYGKKASGRALEDYKKPYQVMWGELEKLDRDIVLNLCQYGMGDVWKWGGEVGHSWRTTGDLGLEKNNELPGFLNIGLSNAQHSSFARPGAWNDPDYLLIGWVGDANNMGEGRPTKLTPEEQYTYMSMWSLMAAPLFFSGDMARLDPFTLNVLCNHEVIEVDQDPLGRQARIIKNQDGVLILAKEMEEGSLAVGLFNLKESPVQVTVRWDDLGLQGSRNVRDLWRQKNLGVQREAYSSQVPRHGVSLVRLSKTP